MKFFPNVGRKLFVFTIFTLYDLYYKIFQSAGLLVWGRVSSVDLTTELKTDCVQTTKPLIKGSRPHPKVV